MSEETFGARKDRESKWGTVKETFSGIGHFSRALYVQMSVGSFFVRCFVVCLLACDDD